MRIRRAASRLLGAAYLPAQPEAPPATASELPTPPPPAPAAAVYGDAAVGPGGPAVAAPEGVCVLSMSPWDLPYDLDDDDSKPQEAPFDGYFVHVPRRPSFAFSSIEDFNMEMKGEDEEVKNKEPADDMKKTSIGKENEEPMLLEEEDDMLNQTEASKDKKAIIWQCKKNDGKRWQCQNIVHGPNTLCEYHLTQSRSYYTPTTEKGASVTAAATNSGLTKASANGSKTTLVKSFSSKPNAAGTASSSKAAPAIAPNSSKEPSSVTLPTTRSQHHKRKSTNGSGGGDYYFYDLFSPFRGKDRSNCSNHRVSAGAEDKELLQQDSAVVLEAKDKMEHMDNNLSSTSSFTSDDEKSDEDYVIGGVGKSRADQGKGKKAIQKMRFPKMAKKRIKERSLKSLL